MTGEADILRLEAIGHNFGGLSVLRSVTFSVPERGIVGLIGPNGSGKTTLFNAITGFLVPQTGVIGYRGRVVQGKTIQERSRAGMVRTFQTPKVFENMTVLENIMVGCCKVTRTAMIQDIFHTRRANGEMRTIRELAEHACEKFELATIRDRPGANLTAGQRRIVEIARAVVGRPQLLMLDEPSSGLNSEEIENLRRWIVQLRAEGMSILLVSHDMELMTVTDIVHVLYFGEIIASGDMDAIKQNARVREVYLGVLGQMLAIESVSAGYGALTVLHDVSLSVGTGEAVAVVGANGAGKTTLVRTICGLSRARTGRIIKSGADITMTPAHHLARHGLAVVLENRRLFGELTVRENLVLAEKVGQAARGGDPQFSWHDVCQLFPVIQERIDAPVELLSGGQQQMVAIARALLLQPDLLIMDEPSTGLAPKIVKDILVIIANLRARGMGLLLIEQNVGIAAEITERAYVMALGRIVHEVAKGEWPAFLRDDRILKAYLGS